MKLKPSDINCHPGVSLVNDPTTEALAEAIIQWMVSEGDEWKTPSASELQEFISGYPGGSFPSGITPEIINKAILLCWDEDCCLRFSKKWRTIAKKQNAKQD